MTKGGEGMEKITEEIMKNGERIRINHKGMSLGLDAAMEFFPILQEWIASKKKFRVTLDYDPEWTALIQFRLLSKDEAEEMDRLNPNHAK